MNMKKQEKYLDSITKNKYLCNVVHSANNHNG